MNHEVLVKTIITASSIVTYFVALAVVNSVVSRFGAKRKFLEKRVIYIKKTFALLLFSILFLAVILIWGIDIKGILIFASSFFAIVGIAFFASWSVLSNITSGVIIFFSFTHKIGDQIRIIDGENTITGEIVDMTLFYIQVKDADHYVTTYPNNLAIQKPITLLKKHS
ncbi:MAG: mechanosensitive ion channel family protein [Desulfobulbaceae bacterium]|nr:mechanosensitive ion channel family protein [Desulfobulbaceae bacterium]